MTDSFDDNDAFAAAGLRLTVDLDALVENWRDMAHRSGRARPSAVVKADAYGLGIEDIGEALYLAGARDFFVATADEGATLRLYAPDARIFVLSGIWPGMERVFFENDLVPVIASEEQLTFWMSVLSDYGDYPCALQVDTGFNRLGLPMEDALALADDVSRPASFAPVLVMSHLACGDDPANPMNRQQLEAFRKVSAAFEGIEASLANSAGIFLGPEYHFDLTRPGIATYGGEAVPGIANPMRPVATAEARIIQTRFVKAGETVGYGRAMQLTRDSRLAIVSAGYADGYMRSQSSGGVPLRQTDLPGGHGFIAGHRVPVAGRITMDLTIFDITDLPDNLVRAGDYVELFGSNILVDDAARAAGTIGYEMLTSLGLRHERRYISEEVEE
ncbi:alanine racemase [Agrobacterium sp. SHOUNA12C]|uniref:alanine racemase n=1 Tax=Rhizobium rhizogenes TaxID=359 RepID=UPI0004D34A03|nr:alanine racemase [Rhizobium rhizogenes]MCJ9721650.1 alanine racemase [Agrobacterium sp. BETTINA12B]MCJ9759511.1 alanine racemase [Agrobacterium sp. SHOUNA12C]OCJ06604.1 alanine racemase [Agrobacterium sp. 13-626]KEA07401.1 alanine racemase [Rhizobium rhizogenes]MQB29120.1 alanine racemase [Rhizobium rhizogenes]